MIDPEGKRMALARNSAIIEKYNTGNIRLKIILKLYFLKTAIL